MKLLQWIKGQLLHVFPVFVFFAITFSIFNFTETFLFKRAGMTPFSYTEVILISAVIAKVVLVIDNLSIVNLFSNKPLIYTTLWKTIIYWVITLSIRLAMRFVPFWLENHGFAEALQTFVARMDWTLFVAAQTWYLIFFFLYVVARELTLTIGPLKVRKMFFGF